MSSFKCEKCGTTIIDTPKGYTTECEHYKLERFKNKTCKKCGITKEINFFSFRKDNNNYRNECKNCCTKNTSVWQKNNPEKVWYHQHPTWRQKEREKAIAEYGGKCNCCGENEIYFLCIDHINNDGNKHRKEILKDKRGCQIYRWLRIKGYPKDNFQLLCWNCNMAKSFKGICPHKSKNK